MIKYQDLQDNYKEMRLLPYKKEFPYSYVFGLFPVIELSDNLPKALFRVIVSSKLSSSGKELLKEKVKAAGVDIVTDDRTIERLSPKENTYAIGVFRKFRGENDLGRDHIVLVDPSDKGNLGNIVRSAVAFGFEVIAIIGHGADLFDPHTVRASMGAVFHIDPLFYDSFDDYIAASGRRNCYPFMLDGSPMETETADISLPCSLIFGNEAAGLDDRFHSIGKPLRISHGSGVDSLNLTVAAGIGMHWFSQCRSACIAGNDNAGSNLTP